MFFDVEAFSMNKEELFSAEAKILISSTPKWSLFSGIPEILLGAGCKNEVINFQVCTHGAPRINLRVFPAPVMSLVAFLSPTTKFSLPPRPNISFELVRVICIIFNRCRVEKNEEFPCLKWKHSGENGFEFFIVFHVMQKSSRFQYRALEKGISVWKNGE
jgi:hypothetical protein